MIVRSLAAWYPSQRRAESKSNSSKSNVFPLHDFSHVSHPVCGFHQSVRECVPYPVTLKSQQRSDRGPAWRSNLLAEMCRVGPIQDQVQHADSAAHRHHFSVLPLQTLRHYRVEESVNGHRDQRPGTPNYRACNFEAFLCDVLVIPDLTKDPRCDLNALRRPRLRCGRQQGHCLLDPGRHVWHCADNLAGVTGLALVDHSGQKCGRDPCHYADKKFAAERLSDFLDAQEIVSFKRLYS